MLEYLPQMIGLGAIALLASMSPGADFAIVVTNSLKCRRAIGAWTAVGVGTGILTHVAYTIVGIGLIISQSVVIFSLIKYLGAGYLIYIGIQGIRSKKKSTSKDIVISKSKDISRLKAFRMGFITNTLNPKATLFFLSLFSQFVSPDMPLWTQGILGGEVAIVVGLWFMLVSFLFSQKKLKKKLVSYSHWIDRVMGGALIALGIKLAAIKQ